ncbi:Hypothetical protein, putative [Bodo saltans]|uniref:Uncharacterized protein n=1 Tax=Bodo saltans TaxID=75058 RepID=A0A0S4IVV4_BODSA|nr:Hypothetical protein, putative [Bodo saltans]|eukprot:CUG21769.1 Hypothetical protein, putative [Bodo saltans]
MIASSPYRTLSSHSALKRYTVLPPLIRCHGIRSYGALSAISSSSGVQFPSPIAFDTKSAIFPTTYATTLQEQTVKRREAQTLRQRNSGESKSSSAVDESSITTNLHTADATAKPSSSSSSSNTIRLGCSASMTVVGVIDNVQHGKLMGGVEVTQFRITSRGYRMRQPGDLKLFQNEYTVRLRGEEWVNSTIPNGTRVMVRGAFSMHSTYDMVSKSLYENPIIDVGPGGYVGILAVPPPPLSSSEKTAS